jgi:hypothetical protein
MRATAFTFDACHHPLSCVSSFDSFQQLAQLAVAAHRDVDPHLRDRLGWSEPGLALGLLRDGLFNALFGLLVEGHTGY